MSAEDDIGGGFAGTATGVGVGGEAAAGLALNKLGAVSGFVGGLVAGGEVEEHIGAGDGLEGGWRDGHPEIFADFDAEDGGAGAEEEVGPEGDVTEVSEFDELRFGAIGGEEPALFVEFFVVGEVLFRDESEEVTSVKEGGDVVDAGIVTEGKPDDDDGRVGGLGLGEGVEFAKASVEQGRLGEEIGAGVAAEGEFWEEDEIAIGVLLEGLFDGESIGEWIGDGDTWTDGRDAKKIERVHARFPKKRIVREIGKTSRNPL